MSTQLTLDGVQAYAQARITADSTLATFGSPVIVSYFTTDEDARKTLQDRLRQYGVCIHIGPVGFEGDPQKPFARVNIGDANFEVFVSEDPQHPHTPQELTLVTLVARAVENRVDSYTPSARCVHHHQEQNEHGYIVHVLSFQIPVQL